MSEDKKSLIDLVPDSVDNAVKNITDKPTQNIGTTIADIWYLIFGGISQIAEKQKIKYSYDLQEFKNELEEKISKIPEDKKVEPDIQVTAQALEDVKYCIEKQELRDLFSNLISSSMNETLSKDILPIFPNVIKQLSVIDAKILKTFYEHTLRYGHSYRTVKLENINCPEIVLSLSSLESLGLIYSDVKSNLSYYFNLDLMNYDIKLVTNNKKFHVKFTNLGTAFCKVCITT